MAGLPALFAGHVQIASDYRRLVGKGSMSGPRPLPIHLPPPAAPHIPAMGEKGRGQRKGDKAPPGASQSRAQGEREKHPWQYQRNH